MSSLENLARANEIRLRRAEDKRRMKRGELTAVDILAAVPEHWRSATVAELLLAIPNVGSVKARRWCRIASVEPSDRLAGLKPRSLALLGRTVDTWIAAAKKGVSAGGGDGPSGARVLPAAEARKDAAD